MTNDSAFERVYTVVDWYDGPLRGIADFRGAPHFYESVLDEEYSENFWLSPVSPQILRAALEDWEIWLRWEAAFHEGRVQLTTHPALPEDRARHDELATLLAANLRINPSSALRARAEFQPTEREAWGDTQPPRLRVRWSPEAENGAEGSA